MFGASNRNADTIKSISSSTYKWLLSTFIIAALHILAILFLKIVQILFAVLNQSG
ncbi:hypothetical protein BDE36_2735 [Arcticibacter tournemirensis]|nr:hypothetical protein BDE36_2735 [Arcticibacter tournemirensis]